MGIPFCRPGEECKQVPQRVAEARRVFMVAMQTPVMEIIVGDAPQKKGGREEEQWNQVDPLWTSRVSAEGKSSFPDLVGSVQ